MNPKLFHHPTRSFDISTEALSVLNPFNAQEIAKIPFNSEKKLEEIIKNSSKAFTFWKQTTFRERSTYLKKISSLIGEKKDDLALLITLEAGKPIRESILEVEYGRSYFDWYSEEAPRLHGRTIPSPSQGRQSLVSYDPIGISALITPWNFPFALVARKLSAALAAGCSIICKPSPETPLSALALESICLDAGLDKDLFHVVNGDASKIGKIFLESEDIRKLSFTGSTSTGKLLIKGSAERVKKLTLELGGNAPFIICKDADLDKCIEHALYAKFRNAGQACIAANRFFIHTTLEKEFIQRISKAIADLKVGDGADQKTDIGPLIHLNAAKKVKGLCDDAVKNGARIEYGTIPTGETNLVTPLILSNISNSMQIANTEIFGPVVSLSTFEDEEKLISYLNNLPSGLASYIFTESHPRQQKFINNLQYGMIGINNSIISSAEVPFGGVRESGYGREGGSEGIKEYLVEKYISIGI